MPELELVEERLISGKGVLRVPSAARKARYWIMYADVIRLPTNEYRELNWNPYQSLYARMVYRRDGYVQIYDHIRFTREQRTYINDITGQNLRAIKCAYEGTLISFNRLAAALGTVVLPYTNLIEDYESIALSWDEILFSCYSDTALQIRFFKKDYDVCNPENDDSDYPLPPPPPLPRVPPGTPIGSISPPYDEGSNDDGNTDPFEGDESEPPPPPEPEPCDKCLVTLLVSFQNGASVTVVGVGGTGGLQYAPIVQAFVIVSGSTTQALVQGGALVGSVSCNGATDFNLLYSQTFNPGNPIISAEITNIEVVP